MNVLKDRFPAVVMDEPLPFQQQRADAIAFLQSFFEAIARRDWPAIAVSLHSDATMFVLGRESKLPSVLRWDAAAAPFKEWLEKSVGVRRFRMLAEEMELAVTEKAALVSLPSRNPRETGERVMVLTYSDDRWQVHHMHLSRLQIPLFDSDLA